LTNHIFQRPFAALLFAKKEEADTALYLDHGMLQDAVIRVFRYLPKLKNALPDSQGQSFEKFVLSLWVWNQNNNNGSVSGPTQPETNNNNNNAPATMDSNQDHKNGIVDQLQSAVSRSYQETVDLLANLKFN
jgi:hypothetical protein